MRLRQIEVFYHVYRAGSISGAARDLHVSQPSVSKVLRHAEDQLGITLFLRSKGRLIPTQAAHELFAEAEDIYARLSTFNHSLDNLSKRRGGHIRLGVLPSLSLSVGPDLISRLRAADPLLSFELTTLHSSEMTQSLLEKQSDLCIGFEPVDDPRIVCEQIGDARMVLVSGQLLETAGEGAGIEAIDGAEFIGMRDSGPLARLVEEVLDERSIEPIEIGSAHTYHVALSLVRKQLGLAVTDLFTAYSQLGAGLHRYLLEDVPSFPIHTLSLADHPDSDLIGRTVSAARDTVGELKAGIARMQPPKP
ncbi:MAG: LysR family transcriptional regulator [Erythrobacter sp.]